MLELKPTAPQSIQFVKSLVADEQTFAQFRDIALNSENALLGIRKQIADLRKAYDAEQKLLEEKRNKRNSLKAELAKRRSSFSSSRSIDFSKVERLPPFYEVVILVMGYVLFAAIAIYHWADVNWRC